LATYGIIFISVLLFNKKVREKVFYYPYFLNYTGMEKVHKIDFTMFLYIINGKIKN